ncbi:class IIb bacteriocin, lactobin A/cerein 7B family [Streptococcus sp. HMSC10E12]|jgi:hypothetical protein|uniref:class IIb bacteriocin, lactobin A/cerein 7B family n=2 Tax=unclassified Streptococcus TaxID=2608887 RepID=UPI00210B33F4|nr:class IIb bacteriocin, lactobin A/cerein 7B family [Streptococcus sp. HMSC10E12]
MCDAELEIISGGVKVGAVIGGCLGGMLMAWAAGPVSAGGYTMICATSGLANAYF